MKTYLLNKNWKFKFISLLGQNLNERTSRLKPYHPPVVNNESKIRKAVSNKWTKAAIPGTVHTDLLNAGLIDDPFYSDNENFLQWIGDSDWLYKTEFNLPADFDKNDPIYLVFDGIDTISKIKLNGQFLGDTENMFRRYEFDISGIVNIKGNVLEIELISAVKYARNQEEKYGKLPVSLRSERVYIRKAQYSFGWDWGPSFITSGIWKDVFLCQYKNKINQVLFQTNSIEENSAEVEVIIQINQSLSEEEKVEVEISDDSIQLNKEISTDEKDNLSVKLTIDNPRLWQPNGYGIPYLYNLKVRLIKNSVIEDEQIRKVGIRTVELKLKNGDKNSFQFIVNGNPVYCKGINWIPADSFLPRVTDEKYRVLLQMAKDANMNIARVWGGGIYEQDVFYNLCDELGIMVWQDFMFACASYPEEENLLKNIEKEIDENVSRLHHHPCIIIWCGNNENEWIWYQRQQHSYKEMPGYKIFSQVIPDVIKKIDSSRPYWESSPFSFEEDPNSTKSGNRHQWNIWSMWIDYRQVKTDDSLFVTEFGFQSPANPGTLLTALPKGERKLNSRIFEFHNKQVEGPERLFRFLAGHLPVSTDIDEFIYLTQLNHSFAMKECLEHWRYRLPETNGSIIWQLNDCWPVASWALVDSNLIPKLPYWIVKNVFAPQTIRINPEDNFIHVQASNLSLSPFKGKLIIQKVSLPKGKVQRIKEIGVSINELTNLVLFSIPLDDNLLQGKDVLIGTLYSSDGESICRTFYTYPEWKYLKLPKVKIKDEIKEGFLTISTAKPAFFISLQSGEYLTENGFILLPGEKVTLKYSRKKIKYKCLNDFLR